MAEKVNEALIKAAEDGALIGVKAALKAGADINFDNPTGPITSRSTALYNAAYEGHVDVVEFLLHKGAFVAQRNETAFAPLHGAAMQGKTEAVEVLVHHGATVDIRDGFQMTPIMYACSHGRVDTVRRLIEFGARVDLVDEDNISAMESKEQPHTKHGCMNMIQEALHKRWVKSNNLKCSKPDRFGRHGEKEGESNLGECLKLVQEALEKKQLRCCNPKCGKPGFRSDLKLCAGCKLTRYCSRECQKQHWLVGHKKCCGHDKYSGDPAELHALGIKLIKMMAESVRRTP